MHFLVDESTGTAVADVLRRLGYDVVAVAESMPRASDREILAKAGAEGRVVVTNDKDFGELVFRSGLAHNGVILLRLQDESSANRVRVILAVLAQCGAAIPGHFIVATETHIRSRPTH
jgi:predicted nuclease of predicted toxin-antitoxin system